MPKTASFRPRDADSPSYSQTMKNSALVSILSASVLAAASSTSAGTLTTSTDWFNVSFDDYTIGSAATAQTETNGVWSATTDVDVSEVVDATFLGATGNALSLSGTDEELVFTPTAFTPASDMTVTGMGISLNVYLNGSESDPVPPESCQTQFYLNTAGTTPVLKAYQPSDQTWVDLSCTVTNQSWVNIAVETSEENGSYIGKVTVNNEYAGQVILGKATTTIESVSFFGTGYVNKFSGVALSSVTIPDVSVSEGADPSSGGSVTLLDSGEISVAFNNQLDNGNMLRFVSVTQDGKTVNYRVNATTAGEWSEIFDRLGTGTITAYYGPDVSAIPAGYEVEIASNESTPATSVAEDGTVTFNMINRVSGLYYSMGIVNNDGTLTVVQDSTLVDAADHGTAGTYSVNASAEDWGVVRIKFLASDDPMAKDDVVTTTAAAAE